MYIKDNLRIIKLNRGWCSCVKIMNITSCLCSIAVLFVCLSDHLSFYPAICIYLYNSAFLFISLRLIIIYGKNIWLFFYYNVQTEIGQGALTRSVLYSSSLVINCHIYVKIARTGSWSPWTKQCCWWSTNIFMFS